METSSLAGKSNEPAQNGWPCGENLNYEFREGARLLPAMKISGEAAPPANTRAGRPEPTIPASPKALHCLSTSGM